MVDQALDAAQTLSEGKQLRVLKKALRPFEVGFQCDRHHSAKTAHLLASEIVLRMRFQTGITHRFHFRLLFQPARDLDCICAVPLHAKGKRFQASQRKETIEWSRDSADGVLEKRNLVAKLLVFTDNGDTPHQV